MGLSNCVNCKHYTKESLEMLTQCHMLYTELLAIGNTVTTIYKTISSALWLLFRARIASLLFIGEHEGDMDMHACMWVCYFSGAKGVEIAFLDSAADTVMYLTLNQAQTHKCVRGLHKSIRIYMGFRRYPWCFNANYILPSVLLHILC